jgi:hypothetical protein
VPDLPFDERQSELESWIGSGRILARYRELLGDAAPLLSEQQMIVEILSREYPAMDER